MTDALQNRGIGRAICNLILTRTQQTPSTPLKLFATSRKGEDLGLTTSPPQQQVVYTKLDIADRESIRSFAADLKRQQARVDVLINNAGVNLEAEYGYENARRTLEVNYWGTVEVGCDCCILSIHVEFLSSLDLDWAPSTSPKLSFLPMSRVLVYLVSFLPETLTLLSGSRPRTFRFESSRPSCLRARSQRRLTF